MHAFLPYLVIYGMEYVWYEICTLRVSFSSKFKIK